MHLCVRMFTEMTYTKNACMAIYTIQCVCIHKNMQLYLCMSALLQLIQNVTVANTTHTRTHLNKKANNMTYRTAGYRECG